MSTLHSLPRFSPHSRGAYRTTEWFTGAESANTVLTPRKATPPCACGLSPFPTYGAACPCSRNFSRSCHSPPPPPHPTPTLHHRVGTFRPLASHKRQAPSGPGLSPWPMNPGTAAAITVCAQWCLFSLVESELLPWDRHG